MSDGIELFKRSVIKKDYENEEDYEKLYLDLGFDGFRCDAAYQIPSHFWHRLIHDIKNKYPDIVFTAETLGCTEEQSKQTAQAGFDYIFNSSKWWAFNSHWLLGQ